MKIVPASLFAPLFRFDLLPIHLGIVFLLSTSGCAPSKYLKEQDRLHHQNEIHFEHEGQVPDLGELRKGIESLAVPEPNYGLWRWRLGLHLKTKEPKKARGLRNWWKNKIGEPPAFYDPNDLENARLKMEIFLFDRGYFNAKVSTDTAVNDYFVTSVYKANPGLPYSLRNIEFLADSSELGNFLRGHREDRLIQTGDRYEIAHLLSERQRLINLAQDNGFMDFATQDLLFFVDTISGETQADLFLKLEPDDDSRSLSPYYINKSWVYQDYSLADNDISENKDTIQMGNMSFVHQWELIRPRALFEIIGDDNGSPYSRTRADQMLSRLLDLGIYKFVNINYEKSTHSDSNRVERQIYLTPGTIRDISAEIRANTRTGNYLGSGLIFSYTHRNMFRGAERFDISLSGAAETQLGDDVSFVNTAEAGIRLNLLLPYVWPGFIRTQKFEFNPKTQISLAYKYEKRIEFYTLSSLSFQFGYDWRKSIQKRHQLYPFVVNQINVHNTTDQLQKILDENPFFESSFEDVFINGAQYTFTFSSSRFRKRPTYFYSRMHLESSGNFFYLLNSAFNPSDDRPYTLFKLPVSQFVKAEFDIRYNINFGDDNLVLRMFYGIGLAYGNSEVLPYVKQYYSGGSNGIRAFPIRTLGPGSYRNPDTDSEENEFIDQTGDMKIEANLEYRFPISRFFRGAFFLDMGNIWLLKDDNDTREGGVFRFENIFDEMAIGTGFGLRLDINSFVLRLDLAFPLRKPFLPEGERWVIDEFDLFDSAWRKENLVWNLALGYPF